MAKNRGTYEGDLQEIEIVKSFNRKDDDCIKNFCAYCNHLSNDDFEKVFMCRVVTKQYSQLSRQVVMTRADAYAIKVEDDISPILIANDYYLDENILSSNSIKYEKIHKSGISIKLQDSSKFQILKLTPNSFAKLFNNTELGAGASLFCLRECELEKNSDLLQGWLTSVDKMCHFYNSFNLSSDFIYDIQMCKMIKRYAESQISKIINDSKELQQKIFNGINLYDEPYCAHFVYKQNKLEKLTYIPFQITTGSGRSKGIYTIVLKPV